MFQSSLIYVAGHRGMVGSAICRALYRAGYSNLLVHTHAELDLCDQAAVRDFFALHQPEYVILAAATVGGIHANATYPAEFIYNNLQIQNNVIDSAYRYGVKKLLFLGSSCIYPKLCPQPIKEDYLLSGPLEPTNDAYALAKIAGLRMCQAYRQQYGFNAISVMPTNLYGPHDNFDPETSHVMAALVRRFFEAHAVNAPEVVIWGSGTPQREFLHVDDMADACLYLMRTYDDPAIVNIGCGMDIAIGELARLIADIVNYKGRIVFDASKPDGTPRKLLDVSRLSSLGWQPSVTLREGIAATLQWYESSLKK